MTVPLLAQLDYTVRDDGKRTAAAEQLFDGTVTQTNTFTWDYDNAGRLISETLVASHLDDYTDTYTFDLVGNRQTFVHDSADNAQDKTVTYTYDNNDRLLTETKDATGTADDRHTVYAYDNTQQIGKTVHEGLDNTGTVKEQTTNSYNLQGRLSKVEIDSDGDGSPNTTVDNEYNASGIRVAQTVDGTKTLYLIDANNHTGYAQVLEEGIDDNANGQLQDAELDKSYTLVLQR